MHRAYKMPTQARLLVNLAVAAVSQQMRERPNGCPTFTQNLARANLGGDISIAHDRLAETTGTRGHLELTDNTLA